MQANNLPTSVLAEGEGSGGVGMATFYTPPPPPAILGNKKGCGNQATQQQTQHTYTNTIMNLGQKFVSFPLCFVCTYPLLVFLTNAIRKNEESLHYENNASKKQHTQLKTSMKNYKKCCRRVILIVIFLIRSSLFKQLHDDMLQVSLSSCCFPAFLRVFYRDRHSNGDL